MPRKYDSGRAASMRGTYTVPAAVRSASVRRYKKSSYRKRGTGRYAKKKTYNSKFLRYDPGRPATRTRGAKSPGIKMSPEKALLPFMKPCTIKWLKSLMSPWDGPAEACNPLTPPIYSQRMRTFCRDLVGDGQFNENSCAAIVLNPQPANDQYVTFLSTSAAYVSDATDFPTACPLGKLSNSLYPATQFNTDKLQYAIVSYGIRIKYIGPANLMQGYYSLVECPAHHNLYDSNHTPGDAIKYVNTRTVPISYDWVELTWSGPQNVAETQYYSAAGDPSATAGTAFAPMALLIRNVVDTSARSFLFETWFNHEIVGEYAVGQQYSEQDVRGGNNILSAMLQMAGNRNIFNGPLSWDVADKLTSIMAKDEGLQGLFPGYKPGRGYSHW